MGQPVEGRAVGPVQIVQAEEHWAGTGSQAPSELAQGFEQPGAGLLRSSRQWGRQGGIEVTELGHQPRRLSQPGGLDAEAHGLDTQHRTQSLNDRLVRYRLRITVATASQDQCLTLLPRSKLLYQARFSDAGLTRDQNHAAVTCAGAGKCLFQPADGIVTPDQGNIQPSKSRPRRLHCWCSSG